MKKLLFVCGGTAGHINPAISVASTIKKEHPEIDIVFAGNPSGMEARLVPQAGFRFVPFHAMGIQRHLSVQNIGKNIKCMGLLVTAPHRAKALLAAEQPDVVVGTGGYVSGPVVLQASKMGIKTVIHEQNAYPGVTNKLLAKRADKVLVAVEKAGEFFADRSDYIVTGNPVRPEIMTADRSSARTQLKIPNSQFCILSFGGSLGAQRVNEAVADVMAWHAPKGEIHHIHATGKYGTDLLPRLLDERKVQYKGNPNLDIREYIDNMAECLAAADVVICRAGAITLSELQVAGKAAVLIPSPNVAENHQYHNAMVLVNAGAAKILEEKDLTGTSLIKILDDLQKTPTKLHSIESAASKMAIRDSNAKISREILALL